MVSIKTLSKWLLITAMIWMAGFVLIWVGYGNVNASLREICLVMGMITIVSATIAMVSEALIMFGVIISAKLKA